MVAASLRFFWFSLRAARRCALCPCVSCPRVLRLGPGSPVGLPGPALGRPSPFFARFCAVWVWVVPFRLAVRFFSLLPSGAAAARGRVRALRGGSCAGGA